jgi:hypothetical protein
MNTIELQGQEYELIPIGNRKVGVKIDNEIYGLKPIKAEKKRLFRIDFCHVDGLANFEPWTFTKTLDLTEESAQLIAEAIKSIIHFITEDNAHCGGDFTGDVMKARDQYLKDNQ